MAKQNDEKVTKGPTGKRYTPEQKQEIAKFLEEKEGERGGIAETMKKFGVSYVLIRSILNGKTENEKIGRPKNSRKNEEVAPKGKPGRKPTPKVIPISFIRLLSKLQKDHQKIGNKIAKLQAMGE